MAFIHNDIATKKRLRDALNEEESMGFQHNDIVTVDVMNKAIAEGGGGGGDYNTAFVTVAEPEGEYHYSFSVELYANDFSAYPGIFVTDNGFISVASKEMLESQTTFKLIYLGDSCVVYPYNTVTGVSGDAVYDSDTGAVTITGDCTITGYTDD